MSMSNAPNDHNHGKKAHESHDGLFLMGPIIFSKTNFVFPPCFVENADGNLLISYSRSIHGYLNYVVLQAQVHFRHDSFFSVTMFLLKR